VTYDPRGFFQSTMEDPDQDGEPDVLADDVRRILEAMGDGPAYVFGNSSGERATSRDLLLDLTPLPNIGARFGGPLIETFRLLKLHGSLDWWGVPDDWTGATLSRGEVRSTFGAPGRMGDLERRRVLPGREPFIIPPSLSKAAYYQNPILRELWQSALDALRSADRVSLIGYSLPPADPVMRGLLETAFRSDPPTVDVVNSDSSPPSRHRSGRSPTRAYSVTGPL
jgi:pimeloyl-ACP methyl ester carboxylesterase